MVHCEQAAPETLIWGRLLPPKQCICVVDDGASWRYAGRVADALEATRRHRADHRGHVDHRQPHHWGYLRCHGVRRGAGQRVDCFFGGEAGVNKWLVTDDIAAENGVGDLAQRCLWRYIVWIFGCHAATEKRGATPRGSVVGRAGATGSVEDSHWIRGNGLGQASFCFFDQKDTCERHMQCTSCGR